jgi:hypothetical protein
VVLSRPRPPASRRIKRLSLAGDGLAERIRSTVFAMLGLTAAAGLGLVLLFSQSSSPDLSLGPLSGLPGPRLSIGLGSESNAGPGGAGEASASDPGADLLPAVLSRSPLSEPVGLAGGPVAADFVDSIPGGHRVGGDSGGSAGVVGAPQGSAAPAADSPAQSTDDGTEPEPPSSPVSGSSSSSGLFVRTSVIKEKDDLVAVSEASPLPGPEPEPEAPIEPEVPVAPTPQPETPPQPPVEAEVPTEPVVEPEVPTEPVAEPEAPQSAN